MVDQEPLEAGEAEALQPGRGMLEMHPNGYGFLRSPENNYDRVRSDPFVPGTMIEKYRLREGLMISGMVQKARKQQGPRLRDITEVDGMPPEQYGAGIKADIQRYSQLAKKMGLTAE